jgi:DNA-binding GntR family transcriptional regulator
MFSCYRATRLTLDRLERPLVLTERISRSFHLLICRHCRNHNWQISGLARLFQLKQNSAESSDLSSSPSSGDSRLSPAAHSRIAAALAARFPTP